MRKRYNNQHKFKVALEALKGNETIRALSIKYEVAPNLIHKWKKQLKEHGAMIYGAENRNKEKEATRAQEKLYEQIGRLKVENEFLKKIVGD